MSTILQFTFLILFNLVYITVLAQVPAIQWQKSLGGTSIDNGRSIQRTADGGYITVGYTVSNNTGDVSGFNGGEDFWVVKLNANGTIAWQKALGGTGNERAFGVSTTTDGYLVVGQTGSNNGNVSGNHGDVDVWAVKLDLSGNLVWQKCFGGTNSDVANSVQNTTDGGFIIAGFTRSNNGDVSGWHQGSAFGQGTYDFWVLKIISTGTLQWQKCLGGNGFDAASAIQQTTDGGYIVTGYAESSNGDVTGNYGASDFWVVKLNNVGTIEWQKNLGGLQNDLANSVVQTTDGYVVAGTTQSNNGNVTGNNGGNDIWVVKLDNTGTLVWQKTFGSNQQETANGMIKTSDGGFVIVGNTNGSNNGNVTISNGLLEYWVLKINNLGTLVWQKCLGGAGNDTAYGVCLALDGGFAITGQSESNNGDVTVNNGNSDFWVLKLEGCNTFGIDTQVACSSFTWINGQTYSSNNTTAIHTIIGGAVNGCDSIVTLNPIIAN